MELYLPSRKTPSWRGSELKAQGQLYLLPVWYRGRVLWWQTRKCTRTSLLEHGGSTFNRDAHCPCKPLVSVALCRISGRFEFIWVLHCAHACSWWIQKSEQLEHSLMTATRRWLAKRRLVRRSWHIYHFPTNRLEMTFLKGFTESCPSFTKRDTHLCWLYHRNV